MRGVPRDAALEDHAARSDAAWSAKAPWTAIYAQVYPYMMPFRQPKKGSEGAARMEHLFDETSVNSTFRGAGQLQQDLFPPGHALFALEPGPLPRVLARKARAGGDQEGEAAAHQLARDLANIAEQIRPYFQVGDWDNATAEFCLDLYAGTGVMLILEGDNDRPVRFVTLPFEECALEPGPYGDISALYWKTMMSRRAIKAAFPKGAFPGRFLDQLEKDAGGEVELRQDFTQDQKTKKWHLTVWLEESETPVARQIYRTRPFIAARYFRVPGETYGRGPAMLALPTAKTMNKIMELTLKAAAIQLLGIWGYRPGGSFNPDTARLAPGQFWPMQATGGVMGPDVTRLDVSAGRIDIANIVLGELRTQLQQALHDERLPEGGATPLSASEVMARMSKVKANYVGAFGRMINEIIPVVIPRVIELLYTKGLLATDLKIDQLLVAVRVISPLAQALKADEHKMTVEAMNLVATLEGPQGVPRRFKLDDLVPDILSDLGVEPEHVRTGPELAAYDQQAAQQAQAMAMMQAALDKPKDMAAALAPPQEGTNGQI